MNVVSAARHATVPEITASDVRHRIHIVADDSMRGRAAGTVGNFMATSYLAREASRLGLEAAGDSGTFFQSIPLVMRGTDSSSTLRAAGRDMGVFTEFALVRPTATLRFSSSMDFRDVEAVYAGDAGDTTESIRPDEASGKFVVLSAARGSDGKPTATYATPLSISRMRYPNAAGFAIAVIDLLSPASKAALSGMGAGLSSSAWRVPGPAALLISETAAAKVMGAALAQLPPGARGARVDAKVVVKERAVAYPARNVVALLRGSDPVRKEQFVAVGAHSDHEGVASTAVDHDSLRSYNRVMRPEGVQSANRTPSAEQWSRILQMRDSVRRLRPPRRDSIYNGADDDGSGSVALLEIAEWLASRPRPARSILLVWHTAEESGILGSLWFAERPTVPRDSIVAQINMDMVGRGGLGETPGGGPRNLQVIGSRRRSSELGAVIDSLNAARKVPFTLDYRYDVAGHPQNRYCRSDHYSYARKGIPIAYFSRGHHIDYHVVTDEPQYIDNASLSRVARFVADVTVALANREKRLILDGPRPSETAACRQ